jgi:HIV Tat-specific factor 1
MPEEPKPEEEPAAKKAKGAQQPPAKAQWFQEDQAKSTKVYVSNLPDTVDEESFIEFMSKCGVIDLDIRTNKPKVKLYRDQGTGHPKGDALCTYVKVESVELALNILDGATFGSNVIKVERAKFEMKGEK